MEIRVPAWVVQGMLIRAAIRLGYMTEAELKQRVQQEIDEMQKDLIQQTKEEHARPE